MTAQAWDYEGGDRLAAALAPRIDIDDIRRTADETRRDLSAPLPELNRGEWAMVLDYLADAIAAGVAAPAGVEALLADNVRDVLGMGEDE